MGLIPHRDAGLVKLKVLLAGHISLDQRNGDQLLGGPPLYQIPIFKTLGFEIDVLTSFDQNQLILPDSLPLVNFIVVPSKQTTTYEFLKDADTTNEDRLLKLINQARKIENTDIEMIQKEYDIVVVSPIAGEFSLDVLLKIASRGKKSFFDLQGITRHFTEDGFVNNSLDQNDLVLVLKQFTVIKGSKSELGELYPFTNPYDSLLIITNNGSNIIYSKNNEIREFGIAKKTAVIDSTGSGDLFLAVLAGLLDIYELDDCINFAHKIAQANLNTKGIPSLELIRSQFELFGIKK